MGDSTNPNAPSFIILSEAKDPGDSLNSDPAPGFQTRPVILSEAKDLVFAFVPTPLFA
jgi:hypothetical protein